MTILAIPLLAALSAPAGAAGAVLLSVGDGLAIGGLGVVPGATLTTRLGILNGNTAWFASIDHASSVQKEESYKTTQSVTTVGAGLRAPVGSRRGKVQPYLLGEVFTVIPVAVYEDESGDEEKEPEDFTSVGALCSFGAEWRFAEDAGVSGEVGATYWYATYEDDITATALGALAAVHFDLYL